MAGLVPAIHVFELAVFQDVGARHKAGREGLTKHIRALVRVGVAISAVRHART